MGSRSWWVWLLCRLTGHSWEIGWSAARPSVRVRHCTRKDCGASEVRNVPAGESWHTPTLEDMVLGPWAHPCTVCEDERVVAIGSGEQTNLGACPACVGLFRRDLTASEIESVEAMCLEAGERVRWVSESER